MFGRSFWVPLACMGAVLAAVLGAFYWTYGEGKDAGAGAVTGAVQSKTIETMGAARQQKETANEKVRRTPLDTLIDGL